MNGTHLDVFNFFKGLDQGTKTFATYIWIGGNGGDLRSKVRTLSRPVTSIKDLPDWNYDGSSTNQAPGNDSEVIIKPRAIYKDPFLQGNNILVMCDTWKDGKPLPSNSREPARKIFEKFADQEAEYGLEQEYFIMTKGGRPVGWPEAPGSFPRAQGPYYCGVGANNMVGRLVSMSILKAVTYSGIWATGTNTEVSLGQFEIQIRAKGISIGDDVFVTRYIMHRVSELFDVVIELHPKPMKGDINGSGMHTNFSTASMRAEGGYKYIIEACEKLGKAHKKHIVAYGEGNDQRLTGLHETCSINEFKYGVGNRGASIRIPFQSKAEGKGYLEDRRPASNGDPYLITSMILETISS